MANPNVNQIAKETEKLKSDIVYASNFSVPDKKLMHQWFKYFEQHLKGTENVQVNHDLFNAFKIMSEIGKIMPPFNIGPHDQTQKLIKGPKQLVEFSKRFIQEDFRKTMTEYVKRQKTKNDLKKRVTTIVTNKKTVEEQRDPVTGIPAKVTTISTTLEVSSNEATSTASNIDKPKIESHVRRKIGPLDPEVKKQKIQNIKIIEKDIDKLLSEQIPEGIQIFKQWISILSSKLNREVDLDNRLIALSALRKCALSSIVAAPFDVVPKGGVINIREFLKQLEVTKIEESIENTIKNVQNVESVVPDHILETKNTAMKIEGKVPPFINQRMQIIRIKQQLYDVKKSTENTCENIDESVADTYKKWSGFFQRTLTAGYRELCERLELERECDKCLKRGTLPDFMFDEELPDLKRFNMTKARSYLRRIKEFNGSDISKFSEIVDFQSMTQQERKEMMLKKRAEEMKKKTGAIPKNIVPPANIVGIQELSNPLVKNDVLKIVTKNMAKALDAIVQENLEDLAKIPTIIEQVQEVVIRSPYKKMKRMKTFDDIIMYHRQNKSNQKSTEPIEEFTPFTFEELPIESNIQSRVKTGNYAPLSTIVKDVNENLFDISSPDLNQSIYEEKLTTDTEPSVQETSPYEPFTPVPLIKIDNQPVTTIKYHVEYESIPDNFRSFIERMVKKELLHWPAYLQDFGRQLKWIRRDQHTGKLIHFSP